MRYRKYPSYHDSGVAWLGEIPEGWEVKKLKYNLTLQTNKIKIDNYQVIALENIEGWSGKYLHTDSNYQGDDVVFHKNDILFGKLRPYLAKVFICKNSGIAFGDILVYRPTIQTDATFAFYSMISESFIDIVDGSTYGSKMPRTSVEFVSDMPLVTPLKKEQQTIATFLDSATAKIDTLIEKETRLIALLKEKRQALVDDALNESSIKNIRFDRVVNKISRPVHRDENEIYTTLGLYNRGRGLFHRDPKEEDELGESDFYWVEDGDLILSGQFAWEGAIALAKKDDNDCIVSHRFPIIRGKENILNTEYLWAFFTTQLGDFILNEHSVGSAGRNRPLNMNTLSKEKIPIPSMKAQLKVAKVVQIEQLLQVKSKEAISLLKEKRTALISAAVTGKIDVREEEKGAHV